MRGDTQRSRKPCRVRVNRSIRSDEGIGTDDGLYFSGLNRDFNSSTLSTSTKPRKPLWFWGFVDGASPSNASRIAQSLPRSSPTAQKLAGSRIVENADRFENPLRITPRVFKNILGSTPICRATPCCFSESAARQWRGRLTSKPPGHNFDFHGAEALRLKSAGSRIENNARRVDAPRQRFANYSEN